MVVEILDGTKIGLLSMAADERPNDWPPTKSSTVLPTSAVPVKVGVVSLVFLSVVELPVSEEGARSGVDGAEGTEASTVIVRAPDALDTFPAASIAFTVMA